MANLQTAEQLQNLIGVRGSVMIFRGGRAIELTRCIGFTSGLRFSGIDRQGQQVNFDVLGGEIYHPQFVITSKARVNWPR